MGADGVFVQSAPDADLAASTAFRVSDALEMEAGVVARYIGSSNTGYGIAPVATVRYTISQTTVYARGLYRAVGSTTNATAVMPRVTSIEESREPAATRSFAVGLQRSVGPDSPIEFEASEQRMGELVRAFFEGDFLTDFDSVYLLDGNDVRQYKAVIQQRLSNTLSGNVSVRYGSIDGEIRASRRATGSRATGALLVRAGGRGSAADPDRDRDPRPRHPAGPAHARPRWRTTPTSSRSRWRRTSPSSAWLRSAPTGSC